MNFNTYRLNEGLLNIPEHWLDQSMNIFVIPDENQTNFVINRIAVPFGVSNEEYYAQVLNQFRTGLTDYQELRYETLSLNDILSHLLEYQWQTPEGKMTQLTLLHIHQEKLLTFTFSSKAGFTQGQRDSLLRIVFSFSV